MTLVQTNVTIQQLARIGEKLGAASAAMISAWQIHNREFDCVHEKAEVHPMAVILGTLLSVAEPMERVS